MRERRGRQGVGAAFPALVLIGALVGWPSAGFGWPVGVNGSEHEQDGGRTIGLQPSGGIVVGGDLDNEDTGDDQTIVAFDPATGAERWRWTLGEVGEVPFLYYEYIQQLAVASNGDVFGVGRSTGPALPGLFDALIVKVAGDTGQQLWLREMDGDLNWPLSYNAFVSVAVDQAGDVVVTGGLQNEMPLLNLDFSVLKLAGSDGATLWRTTIAGAIDGDGRENGRQVAIAPNGTSSSSGRWRSRGRPSTCSSSGSPARPARSSGVGRRPSIPTWAR